MKYFIRCINPSFLTDALYVVRNGVPHKLVHPKSQDRDVFAKKAEATARAATLAKNFHPTRFEIQPLKET